MKNIKKSFDETALKKKIPKSVAMEIINLGFCFKTLPKHYHIPSKIYIPSFCFRKMVYRSLKNDENFQNCIKSYANLCQISTLLWRKGLTVLYKWTVSLLFYSSSRSEKIPFEVWRPGRFIIFVSLTPPFFKILIEIVVARVTFLCSLGFLCIVQLRFHFHLKQATTLFFVVFFLLKKKISCCTRPQYKEANLDIHVSQKLYTALMSLDWKHWKKKECYWRCI